MTTVQIPCHFRCDFVNEASPISSTDYNGRKHTLLNSPNKDKITNTVLSRFEILHLEIEERLSSRIPFEISEIDSVYKKLSKESEEEWVSHLSSQSCDCCKALDNLKTIWKAHKNNKNYKEAIHGNYNGSYFLNDNNGKKLWVFKPENEEKQAVSGIVSGKGAKREHLAYLLSRGRVYQLPYTAYISIGEQTGSIQKVIDKAIGVNIFILEDQSRIKKLNIKDVQSSLLFDLRFNNADRHTGNLLVTPQDGHVHMIDHGCCMTENPSDSPKLQQLSSLLFESDHEWDEDVLEEIDSLNEDRIEAEAQLMDKHDILDCSITRMKNATRFLIRAIYKGKNNKINGKMSITPYDVGYFALHKDREFWGEEKNQEQYDLFLDDLIAEKDKLKNMRQSEIKRKAALFKRQYLSKSSNYFQILYGEHSQTHPNEESLIGRFILLSQRKNR